MKINKYLTIAVAHKNMEESIILHDPDIQRRCDYTKYVAVIDLYRSAIRIRIDQMIVMKYNPVANSLLGKSLVNTRACLFLSCLCFHIL